MRREIIIFLLICSVFILVNSIFALTPLPSFCNVCHSRDYQTWRESSHRKVTCNFCHQRSGILGIGIQRVKVLRMVSNEITGLYKRPVTADVKREQCRLCHLDVETRVVVKNAIRVSHDEFTKKGWQCTECHNTVAHNGSVPKKEFGTMEKCLECHNLEQSSTACTLCHVEGVARERRVYSDTWKITHGPNWRTIHGMGNLLTCNVCHGKAYCSRCHKIDLPHSEAWMATHGKVAQQFPDSCMQCHRENLCKSCHKIEMPHPPGFLPAHSEFVKARGEELCLRCHMKASCTICHARHIHRAIFDIEARMKRFGAE